MSILVVKIRNINENIQNIGANVILVLIRYLLVIMSDVKFGNEVKQINLFNFARICEMVKQAADVGRAGNHALYNPTESLKNGRIVDRCEVELDIFDIDLILADLLLEFQLIVIPRVSLREVDIGLIREDEGAEPIGILLLHVVIDAVEIIDGLRNVGLRTQHVDQCRGVPEDHLLVGRRIVDVVLGREVVQLELDLLNLEVIALHLASLPQRFRGLRYHLLEDDVGDAAATRLRVPHQQNVHIILQCNTHAISSTALLLYYPSHTIHSHSHLPSPVLQLSTRGRLVGREKQQNQQYKFLLQTQIDKRETRYPLVIRFLPSFPSSNHHWPHTAVQGRANRGVVKYSDQQSIQISLKISVSFEKILFETGNFYLQLDDALRSKHRWNPEVEVHQQVRLGLDQFAGTEHMLAPTQQVAETGRSELVHLGSEEQQCGREQAGFGVGYLKFDFLEERKRDEVGINGVSRARDQIANQRDQLFLCADPLRFDLLYDDLSHGILIAVTVRGTSHGTLIHIFNLLPDGPAGGNFGPFLQTVSVGWDVGGHDSNRGSNRLLNYIGYYPFEFKYALLKRNGGPAHVYQSLTSFTPRHAPPHTLRNTSPLPSSRPALAGVLWFKLQISQIVGKVSRFCEPPQRLQYLRIPLYQNQSQIPPHVPFRPTAAPLTVFSVITPRGQKEEFCVFAALGGFLLSCMRQHYA